MTAKSIDHEAAAHLTAKRPGGISKEGNAGMTARELREALRTMPQDCTVFFPGAEDGSSIRSVSDEVNFSGARVVMLSERA